MSTHAVYEPSLGESIEESAQKMCVLSLAGTVRATFNDVELTAEIGTTPEQIVRQYRAVCDSRRAEYLASPKGREDQRRAEESRKKAAESAAQGIRQFAIKNQAAWDECVKVNSDGGYGECVLRYAARWANMMDSALAETPGLKVEDIADRTSHEADTEGITGFMYGCAVGILAQVWKHGEGLRRWHNLATQIRHEGERANESGGVLNPALLTIGGEE